MRLLVIALTTAVGWMGLMSSVHAEDRLRVVTTLSTFADLVETIGGEQVDVASIASPKFNPHFIEAKPSDVLKVKKADLFVHAGLDLELWRWPLVDAAGNTEARPGGSRELDLSRGVTLLEVPERQPTRAEGDMHLYGNPHYWLNPENARVMATAIAEKLSALDADHADVYRRRVAAFMERLDHALSGWQQPRASIQGRELVAYHNAWPYLAHFAGIRIEQFLEPKPGIPPTPGQLRFLETYLRERDINVIVQATYEPRRAAGSLAQRTGASVVHLCHNVAEVPACADYLAMVEHNLRQLAEALGP